MKEGDEDKKEGQGGAFKLLMIMLLSPDYGHENVSAISWGEISN